MPRRGPWKTNPNLLEVAQFVGNYTGYSNVRFTETTSGPPAGLLSAPIVISAPWSGSAGANAGQTHDAPNWFLRVAFSVFDFITLTNLADPDPDPDISDPAEKMPPAVDPADPDYVAGDWINIEFEADAGELSIDDGIDITFRALPFNSFADDPPAGDHIDVLRLAASEYTITYDTDPTNATGIDLDAPAVASSRWSAAATMPFAGGLFELTEHLDYSDLDGGRTLAFEHRYLGDTWWSSGDFNRWQQVDVFVARAYYRSPRYRFVYAGLPPLRQYPRDDQLGGSPRQGDRNAGARSIQGSKRQGWAHTYR